jgi:hypothetical protein
MTKPIIGYYNHETGENITREMNDQEFQEWEDSKKPTIGKNPHTGEPTQSTPSLTDETSTK